MRIHINKSNEKMVQTPFGNIELTILNQILPKIGIKWNGDNWVFISYNTKKKNESTGKELWLPIRAYNFEIALHRAKKESLTDEQWRLMQIKHNADKELAAKDPTLSEIQRALSYGYEDKYLPEIESEKSYSTLYRKFGLD